MIASCCKHRHCYFIFHIYYIKSQNAPFKNMLAMYPFWFIFRTCQHFVLYPANNYMFKVNNRYIRKRYEIRSKLTIKSNTVYERIFALTFVFIYCFKLLRLTFSTLRKSLQIEKFDLKGACIGAWVQCLHLNCVYNVIKVIYFSKRCRRYMRRFTHFGTICTI